MRIKLTLAPIFISGIGVLLVASLTSAQQGKATAAAAKEQPGSTAPEPAPPPNQTYIGVTKCSACHFEKFQDWRKQQEKHAKAFEILPASYRKDDECLKCHTTGHGEPTGFKTAADRQLAGITCEICHGPGSIHAEVAKPFANKKQLTPEQDKIARDSIYKILPQNICVTCHSSRAHKKHPEYKKQ
jgi:cytochrome c554/c'-like protein